ncbi:filamentous hemagglutinin N-terminal domain-containing protein, partial [Chromatiaceae bacterium AAb-1]|nr:filamentous hemagglutinin N-terminal domain-containing protein [Chromatiaceae bacterium AAb-1]
AAWGAERASSLSQVLKARLAEEREALKRAAEQAAVGGAPGTRTAANGVTFINIATPSARGVSHNRFEQFTVPAEGVVLNNSQGPALSVLGGWSDGNRYLAGGTASLILTEVTGSGVSSLRGYTEVLGDSAEFVLANPNGIHCDGCGFINTPRVTLATGSALMLDGALQGFHIGGGKVVIDGAGLNASAVSRFDILSRAMSLNAALYANELNIVTGVNEVDYASGAVRAIDTTGEPGVQFALDASALGAMYANRIRLIGTEAGLGVRSDGLIQAAESLT